MIATREYGVQTFQGLVDFIYTYNTNQIFPLQLANIFGKPLVTFSYDLHGYDPEVREGYDPINDSGGARSYSPTQA